ncbi:hypothetical protein C8R43DRAFT_1130456 [Mycena crocata]|nr:hypothetical protein C8R43DRAFT_1130456 [Mycena crocata]
MRTDLPVRIAALEPPPPNFIPCLVRNHLARNWRDHKEFSRMRNKTYWVLFATDEEAEGVYSRKVDCTAKMPRGLEVHKVVAGFEEWRDVVPVWGKHCFHDHPKCEAHPQACSRSACPAHVPEAAGRIKTEPGDVIKVRRTGLTRSSPAPVKREVKREVKLEVKLEAPAELRLDKSSAPRPRRRRLTPAPPPSYTPVPETESSDSDEPMPPGTRSLYASDSDDDEAGAPESSVYADRAAVNVFRRVDEQAEGGTPAVAPSDVRRGGSYPRSIVVSRAAESAGSKPPSTVISPSTSIESSLSASSAGTATADGPATRLTEKGKGRAKAAVPLPGAMSSISQTSVAGTSAALSASLDDVYYVGAAGSIHHSSEAALADVSQGPVQVVLGWRAATRLGEALVRKRALAEGQSQDGMEVDA